MPTDMQIRKLVKPELERGIPEWEQRVRDMRRVFAWFESHQATILFDPRMYGRCEWKLVGPDAGAFPRLSVINREQALWYAHHFIGYEMAD